MIPHPIISYTNLIQNVLLTSDNPPNVKVADFGLAKVVDSLTYLKVYTPHLIPS